jgi:hypothetical protein
MAEVNRFLTYRVIPYSAALNGTSVAREKHATPPKTQNAAIRQIYGGGRAESVADPELPRQYICLDPFCPA